MKAADAGKHVLCEKPFAMNAAEAERPIRHAEKKGVLVMEAFMQSTPPSHTPTGTRRTFGTGSRQAPSRAGS
jgi:predicted dehydrogenase